MNFFKLSLLLCLIPLAFSEEHLVTDPHLPRPLIIELPQNSETRSDDPIEEARLRCTSWRVAVEANNLSPWKTIPADCVDYVKEYMSGGGSYETDLEIVSNEAAEFARSVDLKGDGLDAWIFDVDETLLSNLRYYGQHGYGSEIFDHIQFDNWVLEGVAQAIKPSLKLYKEVRKLGFKMFLLTGRAENKRSVTINNLTKEGFENWDRLILRGGEDEGKTAVAFKSDKRKEIMEEGFRIIGNSGDQWSDLIGAYVSMRSFKLSNPMYFIS
ncbi:hypothetical protein L1987_42916 [Smallanthus sonchifolius]|uniref:Uncharacterized protein n=1 Tax=Smallanthus sonchifolius TaxID=185202 RepID=A0ACB9GL91_9ASTR|nr:hypothetical protein L1987_42916 [Smallanthus sonchifolius]